MRIAIWIYGGIGGGNYSQGIPALNNFVLRLANTHDVTVYSILPANSGFKPEKYYFKSAGESISTPILRLFLLVFIFISDHVKKPYKVIHGIWLYPAATVAVVLGKLLRIPSIASAHGGEAAALPEIDYGNMRDGWVKKLTLWTCQNASVLNFISAFQFKEMQRHGLQRKAASIIPFGVATEIFEPRPKPISNFIKILHVANLTEVKDQFLLLRSFKEIIKKHPAKLRIVGADYLSGRLQLYARELEIEQDVTFIGPVPYVEISQHYNWADFLLHTSLYEGLPSAIVEAMASGVVVVSTPVGIVADLGGAYFVVCERRDENNIASQLLSIWNDKIAQNRLREMSCNWAHSHSIELTVQQFENLYQETLNERS
ncbi:MAG TPA: hypothetical protein DIW27_02465 [Cytophagales bacterium]|nr:hypothetical protein [Cytophagales bacterium]